MAEYWLIRDEFIDVTETASAASQSSELLKTVYENALHTICPHVIGLPIGKIRFIVPIPISPPNAPFPRGPVCLNGICSWGRDITVYQVRVCYNNGSICVQTRTVTCVDTVTCTDDGVRPQPAVPPCITPPAVPLLPRVQCPTHNRDWQPPCAFCN